MAALLVQLAELPSRKPALVINYATLTGSCIDALGKSDSGVFTNSEEHHGVLIEAGRASGERVWPFPQDEDYDRMLESAIADIRQCSLDHEADHILAARCLRRFVEHEVPWVHLDLSACNVKGGLARIPTDSTGFGVRYSLNLMLEQRLLERLDLISAPALPASATVWGCAGQGARRNVKNGKAGQCATHSVPINY